MYMGVYVDDIIFAAKIDEQLQQVKNALAKEFEIKDLGKLHYFLGMSVVQYDENKSVWIGQPVYTENLLTKYSYARMQTCINTCGTWSKAENS